MLTAEINVFHLYGCLVPADARKPGADPVEPVLVLEVSRWSGGRGRILVARRKPEVELYDRGFIDLPLAFRAIPEVFQRYGGHGWSDEPWDPRRKPEGIMETALHYVRERHGLTDDADEPRAREFLERQSTRFAHCIAAVHTIVVHPKAITSLWPVQLDELRANRLP
ncbi:hypothetical protein [Isoptericola sp. QY 916]|uniref:hypothetical protein n=1 Tax=Isoptericola sp. QY 916 TaxID=2782570 RepID=UPI003D2FCD8B|nr:hypothetical protein [Isoptericola sp. QY 916]